MQFVVKVNKGIYVPTFEKSSNGWNLGRCFVDGRSWRSTMPRPVNCNGEGGGVSGRPCSSMGVDEMNKVWWNETRFSQNLESLFHWQFWAHIGSWAMLWRRAMIMVGNASWWNKFYCKPKGVLCLTGDDLLRWSGAPEKITGCVADRLGFGAPFRKRRLSTASKPHLQHLIGSSIQCFRIYPIQWGAGVQSSTASLVHQCSSPSQVDFRAVLVETYLRLRLLCGTDAAKVTIKMPPKCFTQKGCLPKGALSRDIMSLFFFVCYGRCKRFQGECWRIPNFETPPIEQQISNLSHGQARWWLQGPFVWRLSFQLKGLPECVRGYRYRIIQLFQPNWFWG